MDDEHLPPTRMTAAAAAAAAAAVALPAIAPSHHCACDSGRSLVSNLSVAVRACVQLCTYTITWLLRTAGGARAPREQPLPPRRRGSERTRLSDWSAARPYRMGARSARGHTAWPGYITITITITITILLYYYGMALARLAGIQPGQAATLFPSCKDVLLTGAPAAPERA